MCPSELYVENVAVRIFDRIYLDAMIQYERRRYRSRSVAGSAQIS